MSVDAPIAVRRADQSGDVSWYGPTIAEVVRTGRELSQTLDVAVASILDVGRQPDEEPAVDAIVALLSRQPSGARVQVADAIAAYEHATMQLRARLVRGMVDEAGMTMSAVAGRLRISRQMAARLYRSDGSEDPVAPEMS